MSTMLAVHERLDPAGERRLQLRGLLLREPAGGNRLVDPLLGGSDECLRETFDRLALILGDLRERGVHEPFSQLGLREAEVLRGRLEAPDVAEVPEVPAEVPEERAEPRAAERRPPTRAAP